MHIVLFFTYLHFNVCCIFLSIKKNINYIVVNQLAITNSYGIYFTIANNKNS